MINRAIFLLLILAGCQQVPTRVIETPPAVKGVLSGGQLPPLAIDEKTVILDARPFFEYASAHLPRAISVQWDDFSRPEATSRGLLDPDLSRIARRLALWGVAPGVKVVVVGENPPGVPGFEGGVSRAARIAWMLQYLGVSDVHVAWDGLFKEARVRTPSRAENVPSWTPVLIESLLVSRAELKSLLESGRTGLGASHDVTIIDVRTKEEYLKAKSKPVSGVRVREIEAVNIPWTEFFDRNGRPDPAIRAKLEALGAGSDRRFILVSEKGVRSAAAAHALHTLGFPRVSNYAGGLTEWMLAR